MNFPRQIKQNKPITIAIPVQVTFAEAVYSLLMHIVRFFVQPASKQVPAIHKLKMQLLVVYAVPVLFIFGASGIVLLAMYLCIFELALVAGRKVSA